MKTAVDKVLVGKDRQVNLRFMAMASHYVFDPDFCNRAAGWEKGQVEKNVQDGRNQLWQTMPAFADLASFNIWLEENSVRLWHETPHGTLPGTIADIWEAEKEALMALPPAFDGFIGHGKRVSPTCLVTFERARYSVPCCGLTRPHWGHGSGSPRRARGGSSGSAGDQRACWPSPKALSVMRFKRLA